MMEDVVVEATEIKPHDRTFSSRLTEKGSGLYHSSIVLNGTQVILRQLSRTNKQIIVVAEPHISDASVGLSSKTSNMVVVQG